MGANAAGARRASLRRGARAASAVTAGFDPDLSVVQRAQTPATHHSRGAPLCALLSGWMLAGWMGGCLDVAASRRVREAAPEPLIGSPAGGKGAELSAVLKPRLETSFMIGD